MTLCWQKVSWEEGPTSAAVTVLTSTQCAIIWCSWDLARVRSGEQLVKFVVGAVGERILGGTNSRIIGYTSKDASVAAECIIISEDFKTAALRVRQRIVQKSAASVDVVGRCKRTRKVEAFSPNRCEKKRSKS